MVRQLLWDPSGAVLTGVEGVRVGQLMGEAFGDVADDHGVLLGAVSLVEPHSARSRRRTSEDLPIRTCPAVTEGVSMGPCADACPVP